MTKLLISILILSLFLMNWAVADETHRDDWYLSQPENKATIQLSGHELEEDAQAYIKENGLIENAGYFQSTFKGKPWYSVTYGLYKSIDEARNEIGRLPGNLLTNGPWPRLFAEIQARIVSSKAPLMTETSSERALESKVDTEDIRQNEVPASDSTIVQNSTTYNDATNRDDWYLSQPGNFATIQLYGFELEKDAQAYIKENGLIENAGYFQSTFKGKPWYSVTYGLFKSINEAQLKFADLPVPDDLVMYSPLPRLFSDIQTLITTRDKFPPGSEKNINPEPVQKPGAEDTQNRQELTSSNNIAIPDDSVEKDLDSMDDPTAQANNRALSFNFQDADIRAVINTVSQLTGKNFIIDPRVKGSVTLISAKNLDPDTIYQVFLSVLDVHNIVAVESGELVKLVPKAVVKQIPTPIKYGETGLTGDAQITEVYQLKHGSVRDIVPILKPLLPPTSHFAAHGPTNTVIITDTAANINRILSIVAKLDQEDTVGDTHVIYLQHAQAEDIVGLLSDLIASYQKTADPKATTKKVSIQAHEATNALVIHAEDDQMKVIRSIIAQLDIRRAQVFVEAIIAEIKEDRLGQLGISWEGTNVNSNGQISGGTEYDIGQGGLRLGFLSGFVTSLTGDRVPSFNILLHALRSDSESNVLSTPNLLTLDNEEAEIRVAQEVPFITGQFTTNVTNTAVAPGVGESPIVNPFQTITRKDVGLILKLKPQVNAGNTIRLEIAEELSNISPTRVLGASDLITNKRIVKSTVVVENGQTVVLGGLILDDLSNTVDGVLGLSSIPFIGGLFRNKQKKQNKINLMLFIKPTIIRSKSDLVGFTERKYGSMRELQIEANERSEYLIRGITPSVMPPLNEEPKITPIGQVISPQKEKQSKKVPEVDDSECSYQLYADNPCH